MSPCREQLKRAERWLARVKKGKKLKRETYEDYLWALFESCWQVKDWLKEDNSLLTSIGKTGEDVEDEVDTHADLAACCGIANRSKHWDVKRRRTIIRSGDARVLGKIMVGLPQGPSSIDYQVIQNGVPLGSAVKIAEDAINTWKKILSNWGIP